MIYATNPRAQQAQKCDGDSVSGWRTCLQVETPSQAGDRRINQDQTGCPGGPGDVWRNTMFLMHAWASGSAKLTRQYSLETGRHYFSSGYGGHCERSDSWGPGSLLNARKGS